MSSIPSSPAPSTPPVDLAAFLEAVRRPATTVLCGSTRFREAFAAATLAETLAGNIVLSIGCDLRTETALTDSLSDHELELLKGGLDELHRRKIEAADNVVILNVGGYIGSSTRSELEYARELGKTVQFLEPVCDNTSVAVIIRDAAGRLLMFERATFPPGLACVAGHIDDHGSVLAAAAAEVTEELGLRVLELTEVAHSGGWRGNRCRRHPGERGIDGIGHQWWVFEAVVDGDLNPSDRETRNARWVEVDELQRQANRTAFYADGHISDEEFTATPGVEPVQVQWLADLGLIQMPKQALAAIDHVATRGTAVTR